MESWNIIVNTAILGTDKKNIEAKNLPTNLQLPVETILINSTIDKEEKFLQVSALVYNYRQAGSLPINKQILDAFTCKEENQPYVSDAATKVLTEILAEENIPLLTFWLGLCQQKNQIVQPVFIPQLFDIGINQKKLQTIISICCGNRGEWLSQLNTSWAFIQQQLPEQLWQTGTFEQRKTVLQTIRADKPELAIEWLQQTWPQEDANAKTNLLQLLQINISDKDIDFLNGLSQEKSKKVKDEAIKLLKKIPSSDIVMQYQQALQQFFSIVTQSQLLGLSKKTYINITTPVLLPEALYASGIEKLSSNKKITDDEHVIFQLIKSIPPTFFENNSQLPIAAIIELFKKDAIGKKMIPALVESSILFKNQAWALALISDVKDGYVQLIPVLSTTEQQHYCNVYFNEYPHLVIDQAIQFNSEWSVEFTKKLCLFISNNPYNYTKSFFSQHIHLIPLAILPILDQCKPVNEHLQNQWANTAAYLTNLLTLKSNSIKAFNT